MRRNGGHGSITGVLLMLAACGGENTDMLMPDEGALVAGTVEEACGATVDDDSDGTADRYVRFRTENSGLRWTQEDLDLERNVVWKAVFDFDHGGRIVAVENTSYEPEIVFAERDTYVYDTFGRRLRTEIDGGIDGILESIETVTAWTDAGKPAAATTTRLDGGDYTTSWTYDENARMTGEVKLNIDGSELRRVTVVYDDATRSVTKATHTATSSTHATKTYDAARRMIRFAFSSDDTEDTSVQEWHYAGARLVDSTYIYNGFTETTKYSYSCDG